jgi:hypothetical protein
MGLFISLTFPDDAFALWAETIDPHATPSHAELSRQWPLALRTFLDLVIKDIRSLFDTVDVY